MRETEANILTPEESTTYIRFEDNMWIAKRKNIKCISSFWLHFIILRIVKR